MPNKDLKNEIEPLVRIIETQVIPWWERCSVDHLAVTALTLPAFKRQQLPKKMHTSVKKRIGKASGERGARIYNNLKTSGGLWPKDSQSAFRFPALVFVVEGQADFNVADYLVHCPESHFLLFRDDIPRPTGEQSHLAGKDIDQRKCSVLWFFAPPGTNSVVAYICHSHGTRHWYERDTHYHIVHHQSVIHAFNIFLREAQEQAQIDPVITALVFQTFLHLFVRELREGRYHLAGSSSVPHEQASEVPSIDEAKRFIREHLNESLTTAQVARKVQMSRNNFIQQFKHETGQTFHDFMSNERMELAGQLLREGRWAIESLCSFVGLGPTQFRAQFKAHFGKTPSEFRKEFEKSAKPSIEV